MSELLTTNGYPPIVVAATGRFSVESYAQVRDYVDLGDNTLAVVGPYATGRKLVVIEGETDAVNAILGPDFGKRIEAEATR